MDRVRKVTSKMASDADATVEQMDENHFAEIDAAMLFIEEARRRTERAAASLQEDGAEEHLIVALQEGEKQLTEVARTLRKGTFFAVPASQLSI